MTKPKRKAEPKAVIYVEAPVSLKEAMEELAAEHNRRLTGEVIQALQEYVAKYRRRAKGEQA